MAFPPKEMDLVASDTSEDDTAPPAYGEIHLEQHGLGTSAMVTDDGRVNIRINQLNRRLSQIFTPALRPQVRADQEKSPSSPPYIPTSLGGENGEQRVHPPPSLNVIIQVVGSRGDIHPFFALGKVLKETYGHRVRLATHPIFQHFVQEHGLEFFSIGGDPSKLMAFMVKNPSLVPGLRSLLGGDVSQRRRTSWSTSKAAGVRVTWLETVRLAPRLQQQAPSWPIVSSPTRPASLTFIA